ncbi:hypothetical protein KEM56_004915 [Ascosphaera pollenicola]|nr:hypothetical protein KEM54_001974 [Ascosphaera aggregata]KAI5307076.1 hypothetical protein KEM56_004915 [Ascosphaera pollenicola]
MADNTYQQFVSSLREPVNNASKTLLRDLQLEIDALRATVERLIERDVARDVEVKRLRESVERLEATKARDDSRPIDNFGTPHPSTSVPLSNSHSGFPRRSRTTTERFDDPLGIPVKNLRSPSPTNTITSGHSTMTSVTSRPMNIGELKMTRKTMPISVIFLSILVSIRDHVASMEPGLQTLPSSDNINFFERILRGILCGINGFGDLPSLQSQEFKGTVDALQRSAGPSNYVRVTPMAILTIKESINSKVYYRWVVEAIIGAKLVIEVFPFPFNIILTHLSSTIVDGSESNPQWSVDVDQLVDNLYGKNTPSSFVFPAQGQIEYVYLRLEGFSEEEVKRVLRLSEDKKRVGVKTANIEKVEHVISNTRRGLCIESHKEARERILRDLSAEIALYGRLSEDTSAVVSLSISKPSGAKKTTTVRPTTRSMSDDQTKVDIFSTYSLDRPKRKIILPSRTKQ